MKNLLLILLIAPLFSSGQTKTYHGIGVNVGSVIKAKNSAKNAYIHPEYEINILSEGNNYVHGFAGGVGVGLHAFNDGGSTRNSFLSVKGGYKIDAVAFGIILNFMDRGTAPGGWANVNVSNNFKFQLTYSKYSYLTGGVIYFPSFINRR